MSDATPATPTTNPTFNIAVQLDERKTRNGYYRFTLCLKDSAGAICATIRGFRVTRPYMRIQLPISSWKDSIFSILELRPDLEAAILAAVQIEINNLNALATGGNSE